MWLDSTNSQFLQANLHILFIRTRNRPSRWVKKHQEELRFYVIQVHLVEHQWKHNDSHSDNEYVPMCTQIYLFKFITCKIQGQLTIANLNRLCKDTFLKIVTDVILWFATFILGIFLVFSFHEPLTNPEISTKYHFATDMSIQTS
jgi:hypothetical protein